jgi:hypothetical protein
MPRSPIVLALLMCVAFPASAPAQGLYEPFPEPAPSARSQGYLDRLGVKVSAAQLARGSFVATGRRLSIEPSATAAPARAASTRSGTGTTEGVALVAALCGVLLAGGLLTLRTHR